MNRRIALRAALLATPLVAVLLYIALNWYRIEYEPHWVGAGPAAMKDRFLAFSRLLTRMGSQVTVITAPSGLDGLPPKATLVISAHRLAYMSPDRVKRLARWVDRGGRVVIEAETWDISDPLLRELGVENVRPDLSDIPKGAGKKTTTPPTTPETSTKFEWPGSGRTLQVNLMPIATDLHDERARPGITSITADKFTIALDFDEGAGHVTILPNLVFITNGRIRHFDNADFAWLVVGEPSPDSPVVLFLRLDSPPLSEWLWDDARAVVIAAVLLVVLWLARIVPRFGPLAPDPPPVRRSLAEHIVASGRFLWSRGERKYLLDALRERVTRAARRRGVAPAKPGAMAPAIAHLAEMPEGEVRVALASDATTEVQFVSAAATLNAIESRLARRATNPLARRKAKP